MTPTARSLAFMRDNGWTCQVVEKWNPFAHIRQDLYGFIDILCCKADCGIIGLQVTTANNMAARRTKIEAEHRAKTWKLAGGMIALHGWYKHGERGKRKVWAVKSESL